MDRLILGEKEREDWIWFHRNAFMEDLDVAKELVIKSPRWSIISGYYAMHDITKLYLGKVKGWKVGGEFVHAKTIELLSEALKEEPQKDKILKLIKLAEEEINEALRLNEGTIVGFLRTGKSERGKAQYYSEGKDNNIFNINFSKKASYFLEKIVKPYILIMKGLL